MKIALNLESFYGLHQRGKLNPVDVVQLASRVGAQGVELSDRLIEQCDESELLASIEDCGQHVPSCYLFSELLTPDAGHRQGQIDGIRSRFDRVRRLGAPRAVVIPGALPMGVDPDQARGWIVEALRQCAPAASEHGLQLAIENVGFQADVYARAADLLEICTSVAEMKLVFDAGNFLLVGEDAIDALDLLAPHTVHVHVKDWKPIEAAAPRVEVELTGTDGVRYCPAVLGDGVVNLAGVIRCLKQRKFDGFLSVEYEGVDDPFDAMRKGVEYLTALIEQPAEA